MDLHPVSGSGHALSIPLGHVLVFGRQPQFHLTSPRISRTHVTLSASLGYDGSPQLLVAAHKRCWLQQPDGTTQELQPQQTAEALPGDVLYLDKQQGALGAGFACTPTAAGQLHPTTGQQVPPAPKRRKASKPDATSADAAAGMRAASKAAPAPTAAVAVALSAAPRGPLHSSRSRSPADIPLAQLPPNFPRIFQGCRLVFAPGSKAPPGLQQRAADLGAAVTPCLTSDTTHVIASFGTTQQEVLDLVAAAQQSHQEQPPPPCPRQHQKQEQPEQQQKQEKQQQQQWQQEQQQQEQQQQEQAPQGWQPLVDWFSAKTSGSDPQRDALPRHLHWVTPAWLADSISAAARRDERPYHVWLHQFQRRPGEAAPEPLPLVLSSIQPPAQAVGEQRLQAPAGSPGPPAAGLPLGARQQRRRVLNPRVVQVRRSGSPDSSDGWGSEGSDQPAGARGEAGVGGEGAGGEGGAPAAHRGTDGIPGGKDSSRVVSPPSAAGPPPPLPLAAAAASVPPSAAASVSSEYVLPSPDQVCRPGEEWGAGQRWIEPWDEAAAQQAVAALLAHWHGHDRDAHLPPTGLTPPGSPRPASTASAVAPVPPTNGVCSHAACAAAPACVIGELRRVRANYSSGRRDEFRIKAVERGIRALEGLASPLRTTEDVAALQLGSKTSAKVNEILATGRYARNALVEADERHAVMATFMQVWGVAEATAERWYAGGARTLDQVAALPGLTAQQVTGLTYYEDFLRRIPREEVVECEALVWGAVVHAIKSLTSLPEDRITDRQHVRVMGSYARGCRSCGDIDFILAAGPGAAHTPVGPLLETTLQQLAGAGYITGDMLPLDPIKAKRGPGEHVTWMGVWKGPSSPCHRRIDIKVYARDQLPVAVNYFSSGQSFCRALRYWANTPLPAIQAAAQALNPQGNAFKLSDKELVVIHRAPQGKRWKLLSARSSILQVLLAEPPSSSSSPASKQGGAGGAEGSSSRGGGLDKATQLAAAAQGAVLVSAKEGGERELVVGPAVPLTCETDIFQALGLPYVPPHLRNILT